MENNICLIPSRNSSTRLKGKNIAKFGNDNLTTRTIKQAINSKLFNRIILTSNDQDILSMGKEFGIETHFRNDKFDQLIDIIKLVIRDLSLPHESNLALLLVTCPLRIIYDIEASYNLFLRTKKRNTVVSVKLNENPIQMAWKNKSYFLEPAIPDEYYKSTKKQDHYNTYIYNDAIIFDTVKNFNIKDRNLFGNSPIMYKMPWERSVAIDYEYQLKIARLIYEDSQR